MKLKLAFYSAVGLLFFLSLISVDSDSWWPFIVCVVSFLYLAWVAWRNGLTYDPDWEDEE